LYRGLETVPDLTSQKKKSSAWVLWRQSHIQELNPLSTSTVCTPRDLETPANPHPHHPLLTPPPSPSAPGGVCGVFAYFFCSYACVHASLPLLLPLSLSISLSLAFALFSLVPYISRFLVVSLASSFVCLYVLELCVCVCLSASMLCICVCLSASIVCLCVLECEHVCKIFAIAIALLCSTTYAKKK
jgi:hypothetical protein